jgi:hypothetical protein
MSSPKGFSRSSGSAKKKASEAIKKRKAASNQYEKLKDSGSPEFNIYVRLPDKPDNWLPVGSMAVQRSSAINAAIFQNQEELLKGALRLFPKLSKRKHELEYGYRLKDPLYADEAIQLAQRPAPSFWNRLRDSLQNLVDTLVRKVKPDPTPKK